MNKNEKMCYRLIEDTMLFAYNKDKTTQTKLFQRRTNQPETTPACAVIFINCRQFSHPLAHGSLRCHHNTPRIALATTHCFSHHAFRTVAMLGFLVSRAISAFRILPVRAPRKNLHMWCWSIIDALFRSPPLYDSVRFPLSHRNVFTTLSFMKFCYWKAETDNRQLKY